MNTADILKNCSNKNIDIHFFETTDSTNSLLKEMAKQGAEEGTVVIANQQTKGRGRLNRVFFSPGDSGIYMSILIRPNILPCHAVSITTATAVAVSEAIETLCGKETKIKWVNDILINGKKVCGILTESVLSSNSPTLDYAVVGIGINLFKPRNDFPSEIKDLADAIFSKKRPNIKEKLISLIINNFFKYYNTLIKKDYMQIYRERSAVIGREVLIISGEKNLPATVLGIDDNCRLHIRYNTGIEDYLNSGEISIKI